MLDHEPEIQELISRINVIEKAYEHIRLVDPILKRVINCKNNKMIELQTQCFDFWNRNRVCDNCISMRAYNEGQTYVKVEYTDDRLFMITAVPVELSGRRVVLELLKDATDSLLFGAGGSGSAITAEIHTMIDSMNRIAMKDGLTGVFNRRYINEKLPIDVINALLADQELSVILADIDHFKKVNDTYGHLVGDCALKSFAETLAGCVKRDSDWVARFGGEEFLICLPGAKPENAREIAERMRKAVEAAELQCGDIALEITASFGVFSGKLKQGDNMENIIGLADQKLYAAKNNGRNRVE